MRKPTVCTNSQGQQAVTKYTSRRDTDRSIVQVKMGLLDTLAMVPLWVGQAKESLLEEGTMSHYQSDPTKHAGGMQTYSFSFQKAKAMFW